MAEFACTGLIAAVTIISMMMINSSSSSSSSTTADIMKKNRISVLTRRGQVRLTIDC